ncbi:DUF6415 family natural product biosynthesis protein [Streptomyces phytohabitans]|uniref:DUF6415 family natural product biosynthesis protein n=1 Tax=Streptomyces phytohabitans TaxID=1150371 RepID=UPI00345BF792
MTTIPTQAGTHALTAAALDLAAARAAVDRALRPLASPSRSELERLERELRGHAEALLPVADVVVGRLWPDSFQGEVRRGELARIRAGLGPGCGDGMTALAVHVRVRQLARDCRVLVAYVESGQ